MLSRDAHDYLFTLRPVRGVTIHAFDANHVGPMGHSRIDVVVKVGRKTIFPRGATYCAVASGHTVDGKAARELVLSLVAMRPGDTDADYFASYTPEQLDFARTYGEEIDMVRFNRYGEP